MSPPDSCQPFPLEQSSYYQFWLMEKAEIDRLKWLESEKAGMDIGFHRAQWLWIMNGHRSEWLDQMRGHPLNPRF